MVSQIEGDKLCILLSKGSFSLSEECEKEYRKRAGIDANVQERLLIPFRFDPDTPPGPVNIRIDPVLFTLYREKGSQWCSGSDSVVGTRKCSKISGPDTNTSIGSDRCSGGKLFLACVPSYFSEYFEISVEDNIEIISIDLQNLLENILEGFISSTKEYTTDVRETSEIILAKHIKSLEEHYTILRQSEKNILPYSEYVNVLEKKWNATRDAVIAKTTVESGWSVVKKRTSNNDKYKKELNPIIPCKPSINPFSYLYDDN